MDSRCFDLLNARSIPPLKGYWGIVADGRMTTVGVVPALDVMEYGHASLGVGLEGPAVQEFTLQRGEESSRIGHCHSNPPTDPIDGLTLHSRHRLPKA